MAAMTRRWTPVSRSPCAARNASPWRRKISATSSAGRTGRLLGRDYHYGKAVKGARRAGNQGCGHLGVPGRRRQLDVPEQDLDNPDVGPALQKMSGKTVPERVGRDGLADPRLSPVACRLAARQAACKAPVLTGVPGSWPGNSH